MAKGKQWDDNNRCESTAQGEEMLEKKKRKTKGENKVSANVEKLSHGIGVDHEVVVGSSLKIPWRRAGDNGLGRLIDKRFH